MTRYSQVGSEAEALKKQRDNKVPNDQIEKWFHGTNLNIKKFHNKNDIWLSRSEDGGRAHKKRVVEVHVIDKIDNPHWEWPGAGDPGGRLPDGTPKDKHWLMVEGKEVEKLMVINDKQTKEQEAKKNYSIFDSLNTSEDCVD